MFSTIVKPIWKLREGSVGFSKTFQSPPHPKSPILNLTKKSLECIRRIYTYRIFEFIPFVQDEIRSHDCTFNKSLPTIMNQHIQKLASRRNNSNPLRQLKGRRSRDPLSSESNSNTRIYYKNCIVKSSS